jgi:hypothetical protein
MTLFELLQVIDNSQRIRRSVWNTEITYLIKGVYFDEPMVKVNMHKLEMTPYMFTVADLVSEDWELC